MAQSFIGKGIAAQTVYASGTTLFHIAAQYLNDPTQWYRIAIQNQPLVFINDFFDPWITGVAAIQIPQPGVSNGGILFP